MIFLIQNHNLKSGIFVAQHLTGLLSSSKRNPSFQGLILKIGLRVLGLSTGSARTRFCSIAILLGLSGIAATAREELHTRVGLAAIFLEAQRRYSAMLKFLDGICE
jgi:hypothetical protein